jgi:hypothetical protein
MKKKLFSEEETNHSENLQKLLLETSLMLRAEPDEKDDRVVTPEYVIKETDSINDTIEHPDDDQREPEEHDHFIMVTSDNEQDQWINSLEKEENSDYCVPDAYPDEKWFDPEDADEVFILPPDKVVEEWHNCLEKESDNDELEYTEAWGEPDDLIIMPEDEQEMLPMVKPIGKKTQMPTIISNSATETSLIPVCKSGLPYIDNARLMPAEKAVLELNKIHALTTIGAKVVILYEFQNQHGQIEISFLSTSSFRELYSNRSVISNSGNLIKWGAAWLASYLRRQVLGVHFNPGNEIEGWYNLWKGLKVKPSEIEIPEKWCHYRKHVEQNVCNGDPTTITYVWGWLADMFQNPAEKPGVALVLRGDKGVGKGAFVAGIQNTLGTHSIQIHQRSQFTGKFNSHLADKLLVFVDEGFWSGDKSAEGVIKGLITEQKLTIEKKGVDAIEVDNFSRFIIASNEDWVVPASEDERRFCVIDVSDAHAQNHDYFKPIFEEINGEGASHLLRFLLDYDLTSFNIRQAPLSPALLDQKLNSLRITWAFWFDALQEGFFFTDPGHAIISEGNWGTEKMFVFTDSLHDSFVRYCKCRSHSAYKQDKSVLIKELFGVKGVCSEAKQDRLGTPKRKRGYWLPPLSRCRELFEIALKAVGMIDWDESF